MSSCEKCWGEAYRLELANPTVSQAEHYQNLIEERQDNPCTPEQQAGEDADICPRCKRKTIHQHTKKCMNPDCEQKRRASRELPT